jgi:UBX domain-containing protein 6
MSFLKDLFEKRKDKKYGKGHKLGSTSDQPVISNSPRIDQPANQTPRQAAFSDAAQKAGEAALQRLANAHNKNTARPSTPRYVDKEREEQDKLNKELDEALKLKEHYFGKPTVVEDSNLVPKNRIYFTAPILPENERYTQHEIEDRIEQLLMEKIHEEPILVACTLLCTFNYKDSEKLNKCKEILNKFANNILNNPSEEKYRKIRVENQIFKEKVYSCKYADLVLKQAGFKAKHLRKEVIPLSSNDQEKKEDEFEDFFVYEGDNLDPLNSLKTFLSLAEPIKPELHRDIKVFRANTQSNLSDFNLSDEFYNLKIEEIKREQAVRAEALEKSGMLRTKAMRERDEQLELRRYNYCLIRVRFPNSIILQALFKSTEKYQSLYELVSECLETDSIPFEFFSHSLKKPEKNVNINSLTLAELGLAPAALLNFRFSDLVDESIKSKYKNYLSNHLLDKMQDF